MKQDRFQPGLTPAFVAQVLGLKMGTLGRSSGPQSSYSGVTSDSRKITKDCLFVALKGELHDGHDFIQSAIQQGATGIICKKTFHVEPAPGLTLFQVEDTLEAYRKLGAAWRKEFQIPLVAVAGSVGKTTTKELLFSILTGKWEYVLKTQGSQNGFIGIPMTLLELNSKHQAAVVEVGIDEIGAMDKHIKVVQPTHALLTAIGPEHLEKLKDVPTVAREEGLALFGVSQTGGVSVINLDDPWIKPFGSSLRGGKKLGFSLLGASTPSGTAALSETEILRGSLNAQGSEIEFQGLGLDGLRLPLPLLGQHNASNLLGAVAMACSLGLTADEIKKGLTHFKGAGGRSEIKTLKSGNRVLCDYYNANPTSVEASLDLLSQLRLPTPSSSPRRWACLGDMLELGTEEVQFHKGLANKLVGLGIEKVLLYGPLMTHLKAELEQKGWTSNQVEHFEDKNALSQTLISQLSPGDLVLIKGSRGMRMEEVWNQIEKHFGSI